MTPDPDSGHDAMAGPTASAAADAAPLSALGLPAGDLTFSRVVADASAALTAALDRRHTGYAVLTPSDALVLDDGTHAVLALRDGIPTHALALDRGGSAALAAAATPGPLRVALHECEAPRPDDTARIAPDTPARRLAGDDELAARTRDASPAGTTADDAASGPSPPVPDAGEDLDAVDAFLADSEAIDRIKRQARAEAERRAREWGFDEFTEN